MGLCLLNDSIMLAACSWCGAPDLGSAALCCAQQPSRISGCSLGVGGAEVDGCVREKQCIELSSVVPCSLILLDLDLCL